MHTYFFVHKCALKTIVCAQKSVHGNIKYVEPWSEVGSMKIAFFAIFDPTWSHILVPTGPNMGFLKQKFNFQSL